MLAPCHVPRLLRGGCIVWFAQSDMGHSGGCVWTAARKCASSLAPTCRRVSVHAFAMYVRVPPRRAHV